MKKAFVILVLLAMLVSTIPVEAQGAYEPGQFVYLDAQVNVFHQSLAGFETQYYATHGEYFQALSSHLSPPELLTAPDGLYLSPTDQPTPLSALWSYSQLPSEIAWSFRVDTYSSATGPGYVLIVSTSLNGIDWQRNINYGPEAWRNLDWFQVMAGE